MTDIDIINVVRRLVGKIKPVGETNTDNERLENLKTLCNVVNALVYDIDEVAYEFRDRKEYSIKRASDFAKDFLTNKVGILE